MITTLYVTYWYGRRGEDVPTRWWLESTELAEDNK